MSVPSHWDYDRIRQEVAPVIEDIVAHSADLAWGQVYSPQYRLSAVIGVHGHAEFEPDYGFPDEAPPAHPDQSTLEL